MSKSAGGKTNHCRKENTGEKEEALAAARKNAGGKASMEKDDGKSHRAHANSMKITKGSIRDYEDLKKIGDKVLQPGFSKYFEDHIKKINDLNISLIHNVGFMAGYERPFDGNPAYYLWIGGVLPGHRGKGVGKLLLEHNISNYKTVWLKTYSNWTAMIKLVEHFGFKFIRKELGNFGESLVYLLKR